MRTRANPYRIAPAPNGLELSTVPVMCFSGHRNGSGGKATRLQLESQTFEQRKLMRAIMLLGEQITMKDA
jgi:hypothetical protein